MAYNRGAYNPDALPAHAEPEQAAQSLSSPTGTAPPRRDYSGSGSYRPQPPPPSQAQNMRPSDDRYRPSGNPSPGGYGGPPPGQGYGSQAPPPPPPQRNSNNYGVTSPPPPANYGQGPPPPGYHNRPPIPDNQRPPTTAPPPPRDGNDRDSLWPLFLQVDKDRSGQLSEAELQRALVNGDYTAFDPHTVKMMIRMFDADRSGTINFDEFCGLWGFLAAWRGLFDRFDTDRSGSISLREFEDAIVAFGYRLSPQFVQLLFSTFARTHSRGRGDDGERQRVLSFDLFVQACISLKRMTDVFKKYDSDRDGYITLSFEEFLTGAQALFLFNSISPQTDTGLY
ncbi:EF-hand [Dissoconium aciculare CBS 342.82]|uniref:EF-hand n=1 Tax=Dissoconium aciculare CBS 342.82 TaxID=1314786 RepID=A0A6J3LTZ5_9PEZI|nr:EF-hand [Dissoconium aciculare CBS 342.82]KAF1818092.1 EF-hand [Dissoconium aciculare CBS 342.82]